MNIKITLYTKRLILRPLKTRDITDKYINGLNDPEVNNFLDEARLKKQTFRTIKSFIEKNLNSRQCLLLGLFTEKNNELIGTVRIHDISYFHYFCVLGICIFDKNYWNKGYAQEALRKTVKFIFNKLELHYIEAGAYKANIASLKLFKKAGFVVQAVYKNKFHYRDDFSEVVMFGLINKKFNYKLLK